MRDCGLTAPLCIQVVLTIAIASCRGRQSPQEKNIVKNIRGQPYAVGKETASPPADDQDDWHEVTFK